MSLSRWLLPLALLIVAVLVVRSPARDAEARMTVDEAASRAAAPDGDDVSQPLDTAIFAGGCFWCMEPPYEKLDGIGEVISGYTSGRVANPTYEQVSAGGTGHTEAVLVQYDPSRISYERLLDVFWYNIDPLTADAQFCDHGSQYRSGIYPRNAAQRAAAEASKRVIEQKLGQTVVTEIVDATTFWPAETYHQDYYKKNPVRYRFYRFGCGRDARLESLWGEAAGVGVMAGAGKSQP